MSVTDRRTRIASLIDYSVLKATATQEDVRKACAEARLYRFCNVTVNPCYVSKAANLLRGSGVKVCSVIGFPLGATTTVAKVTEALKAMEDGAEELDVVMNLGLMKSRMFEAVKEDVKSVVLAAKRRDPNALVKVIIEACYLTDEEKKKACQLTVAAGADFVKSSTGFGTGGATPSDISLMRKVVGPSVGVKASGGIKTLADVESLLLAGASRIGTSNGPSIIQEIT